MGSSGVKAWGENPRASLHNLQALDVGECRWRREEVLAAVYHIIIVKSLDRALCTSHSALCIAAVPHTTTSYRLKPRELLLSWLVGFLIIIIIIIISFHCNVHEL